MNVAGDSRNQPKNSPSTPVPKFSATTPGTLSMKWGRTETRFYLVVSAHAGVALASCSVGISFCCWCWAS
jgi:hypothetical protein